LNVETTDKTEAGREREKMKKLKAKDGIFFVL